MGKHSSDEEILLDLKKRFEDYRKAMEELKTLNEELVEVNKKLEGSESLKSHFISNITNEIINPFSSILGLSKAILSVDKENWKKVFSMVALIHSEAFSLDFQFRNIFVAAKVEAGEIYPEIYDVDIHNLVESVIESFKHDARKRRINLKPLYEIGVKEGEQLIFKTDPEKLKLILSNLIRNAINFSFDDSDVEIKVWLDKDLNIYVKDNGTGISKENHAIIFDRFNRLDSGINSINRGHGLGLSVVKALIDMLEGKIVVDSEIGKGSCFTISIPQSESESAGFASDANEAFFNDFDKF